MEPFDAALKRRLIAADPSQDPQFVAANIDELANLIGVRSQIDSDIDPHRAAELDAQIKAATERIRRYREIVFGEFDAEH
jgi:hypothetical protein